MLVAHTVGNDVTDGYAILSVDNLRKAAQKVADRLMELCEINAPPAENVVRLG